jgi:hypothetical protein
MPEVRRRVGRYDLLEVVGRGGAAVVYLAVQRDLQRHVALKELSPYVAADTSFAERFVEESRLAGAMSHANVVTVHEFFEDGGVPYIAMEFLPHGSLRQHVGELSTAQIAGVLEGVLAGLSHGESHGIVHRDLKPENLLVSGDGRVKIADFGVARAYNQAVTREVVTVQGTTIGTPAYMSPEQALGTELTPATDLYSLGVVAWELLTGQVPFEESETPVAVLYRHVHEEVPSVRSVAPAVDPGVEAWLARMLAKRPEDRYAHADEAWVALEDVVLELLGPRWRREARLVVAGEARDQPTLPPAPFDEDDQLGSAPASLPRAPVPQTITDLEPAAPAGDQETVAPQRRPRRSYTTLIRSARRHAGAREMEEAPDTGSMRRRLIVLAIGVAMIVAAVAGVMVATSGGHHSSGPTAAQKAAAQRAATAAAAHTKLVSIATTLAGSRSTALSTLAAARTPTAQAGGASAVQRAYSTAATQAAAVGAATSQAPPLTAALRKTASAYGSLATAYRHDRTTDYASVSRTIAADESTVRSLISRL